MAHLEHPHGDVPIRARRRPGHQGKVPMRRRKRETTSRRTTDDRRYRNWGEQIVVDKLQELQVGLATSHKFHQTPEDKRLTVEFAYEPHEFSTGLNRVGMRFIKPDFGIRVGKLVADPGECLTTERFDFYLEATLGIDANHLDDKLERIWRAEQVHGVTIRLIDRQQIEDLTNGYSSILDFFPEHFRELVEHELGFLQDRPAA